MPRYIEIVSAASETATKILALRAETTGKQREVTITANGGRTASVTWSPDRSKVTLDMPSLPPDAMLNRAEADRLVAFIIHECCHVLHSSRTAWNLAVKAGPRVRDWTNSLEDVRIEATEIEAGHFPAMRGLLAGIANHLHSESVVEARQHGRVIGALVDDAPYVASILGRLANGYAIPAASRLAGDMAPGVAQLLAVALPGIRRCKNTNNVRQLAERLVAMEQGLQQQQPEGENKGQDEGQKGEGEDQKGEGQDEDQDEDQDEGQKGEGESQGGSGREGEGGADINASLGSMIDKIAERMGITDLDKHTTLEPSHALSVTRSTINTAPAGRYGPGEHARAADLLTAQLPRNSVLHGQIGRLLVSNEIRGVTHHESSGRLDRRALVRMRAGAVDVYSRRDDQAGVDTALLVLIDGSASMSHSIQPHVRPSPTRMAVAICTAWHIARAAEAAAAKVTIAAFHSSLDHEGAVLTVVKPWDAPIAERAANLAGLFPRGSTPLSPAILAGATMLAEVPATRRILMVLTDGQCNLGPGAVTRACALSEDHGVEAVGIGMNCPTVAAAFPPRYSVNVEDLAQLAAKGLGVLVTMLEDANPRGAD